ncbi:MAG: hypothetical protein JWQ79_3659 [Mucilaginibacter sp.]|nr:hypothetical protein [Mucilaginibacter sp.]
MKKIYSLITLILLLSVTFKVSAQDNGGFDQLIKSSPGDATKLFQNYAEPLFKGFGIGLNSGWNNTAKTKKLLHFDLRITVNAALVPASDKSFDVRNIGLSNHLTVDASSPTNIAPTFAGDKDAATPVMRINDDNGTKVSSFSMPKGIISVIPAPDIQLTIGLVHNTDLTIRTTPTIKISDDAGSVGMFGFGIKHDIIQDFAKGIPKPFDLALAVNYSRIKYTKTLDVQPDAGATPAPGQSAADFSTQRISATFSGVNVEAIISKKLLFFTPFAAVAYQTANTDVGAFGNFPLQSTTPGQTTRYVVVTDPVHIKENSISGMRGDIGFQLNLAIVRFYASYSVGGSYSSANAGLGFGF